MIRRWLLASAALLGACDSPPLVSFNTPESCEPEVSDIATFTEAEAECDGDCQLCIETERDDRAVTYFVSHEDNCVCPAPERAEDVGVATNASAPDGAAPLLPRTQGPDAMSGDAATTETPPPSNSETPDSGTASSSAPRTDAGSSAPVEPADGCHSRLHLTRSEADDVCDEWSDCHVCVERVNLDNEPRSYLAHQCGCPDPYRLPL